ncbi:M67 family peptidase [Synechococcus sp. RSCCF101]|uniref:M67 family metallopeptidase n=1 Tax=Synechococcus sp. RSCCF101 TaxID=2511069 RepID=UPI00124485EF|nr:M67 family metallopeptidase [Synechococcus sp. RSCCF101]QEY32159.1 M67 family peptidase [Synechococcus sp. RSCCF101]
MEHTADAPSWPAAVLLPLECLRILRRLLAAASPEEGCCLLLSPVDPSGRDAVLLEALWPCRNVQQPPSARQRHFLVDPREQLLAQRWARGRGLRLVGHAHSHPAGPAVSSPLDRAMALHPALVLIWAGGQPARDGLRAWWLEPAAGEGPSPSPRPVPIHLWHRSPLSRMVVCGPEP